MTKLDEIIKDYHPSIIMPELSLYRVHDVKEIAIAYAKLCLEKAAEHAVVFLPTHYGLHLTHNVDKQSIINIELP